MNITKKLISKICIYALIALSMYVSINGYNNAASFLFCLLIALGIVLVPLVFCYLASLIKKQLFHYTLWSVIILIIGVFIWTLTLPDTTNSDPRKWDLAAEKHFRNKAGLFSWYSTVTVSTDYINKYTDSEYYIIKIIYLKGRKKLDNFYLGKVQIDHNFKFKEEFYDIQAISDTALLKKEYGKLFSFLSYFKKIETLKGYRKHCIGIMAADGIWVPSSIKKSAIVPA